MRILLLSDIHANSVALEAVLASAAGNQTVWCLGDVVGYGPAPNECVARLRGLNALTLAGNHDQAAIGKMPLEEFSPLARTALQWTIKQLTSESRTWLAARAPLQLLPEYDLTLVHASPRSPLREYIENEAIASENLALLNTAYCFFGHTHQPIAYRQRPGEPKLRVEFLPERQPYLVQPRLLLNPGSVGQPRDGDPRAAYAIYDTDSHILTHYRVEYDIAATQRAIANAGLPYRLAARLAQGA